MAADKEVGKRVRSFSCFSSAFICVYLRLKPCVRTARGDDLAMGGFAFDEDGLEAFGLRGEGGGAASAKGIEHCAARRGDEAAEITHQGNRFDGGMGVALPAFAFGRFGAIKETGGGTT